MEGGSDDFSPNRKLPAQCAANASGTRRASEREAACPIDFAGKKRSQSATFCTSFREAEIGVALYARFYRRLKSPPRRVLSLFWGRDFSRGFDIGVYTASPPPKEQRLQPLQHDTCCYCSFCESESSYSETVSLPIFRTHYNIPAKAFSASFKTSKPLSIADASLNLSTTFS